MSSKIQRAAVVQFAPGEDLKENLRKAGALIDEAAEARATLIGLPETFTIEYRKDLFASVGESIVPSWPNGEKPTFATGSQLLASKALQHGVTIFGGLVERDDEKLFNSVAVYGPAGTLLAVYRKLHLSCVRAGTDKTSEADVFAPGERLVHFEMPESPAGCESIWRARVGLGICFDLRFDIHRNYARSAACDILAYPSAFLESTGQDHWEILLRARAIDEQVFVIAPNHAKTDAQHTKMFGHAMICSPWGHVLASTKKSEGDCFVVADLLEYNVSDTRTRIPLRTVRREFEGIEEVEKTGKRQRC